MKIIAVHTFNRILPSYHSPLLIGLSKGLMWFMIPLLKI